MVPTPKALRILKQTAGATGFCCLNCESIILPQKGILYVIDTRNGKLCITCAVKLLDDKIKELIDFKLKIKSKVILEGVEEDGSTYS